MRYKEDDSLDSVKTETVIKGSRSQMWHLDAECLGWGEEAGKMMGGYQLLHFTILPWASCATMVEEKHSLMRFLW